MSGNNDGDDGSNSLDDEQLLRAQLKPNPSIDDVIGFVSLHWLECKTIKMESMRKIESYDDANFYCEASADIGDDHDKIYHSYLIKCYNAIETSTDSSSKLLHGLGLMLTRINEKLTTDLQVPTIVMPSSIESSNYVLMNDCLVSDGSRKKVAVRLFKWIHGYVVTHDIYVVTHDVYDIIIHDTYVIYYT